MSVQKKPVVNLSENTTISWSMIVLNIVLVVKEKKKSEFSHGSQHERKCP